MHSPTENPTCCWQQVHMPDRSTETRAVGELPSAGRHGAGFSTPGLCLWDLFILYLPWPEELVSGREEVMRNATTKRRQLRNPQI